MLKATLLTNTDRPKKHLCKIYKDDSLEPKSYENGYLFNADILEFNNITELYNNLLDLESDPYSAIIRATPINNHFYEEPRNEANTSKPINLIDNPIKWVCIDVDEYLELPKEIKVSEIPEFLLYSLLDPCFHNVDYVFQYSSSAFLKHKTKGHFWFLTTKEHTSKELANWWFNNQYCDRAMFKANQPHYTATPLFTGTVKDPIKQRTVLAIKDKRTVDLVIPTINAVTTIKQTMSNNFTKHTNQTVNGYTKWRVYIDQITQAGAHSHTMSGAGSYNSIFGTNADWNYFKQAVLDKMQSVGHPRANFKTVSTEVDDIRKSLTGSSYNKPITSDQYYVMDKLKGK